MSQTITSTQPPHAATAPSTLLHPFDILMNLIVALLAPMFLCVTGGDVSLARMAATETVAAYRARDLSDLIAIAQIIAYGLAAIGSLSRSMEDDIPLAMVLRLRNNANALGRSAELNRQVIRAKRDGDPVPRPTATAAATEAPAVIAEDDSHTGGNEFMDDKAAKMLADEAAARLLRRAEHAADRAPVPALPPDPAPATAHTISEKRHQEMWAIAMVHDASEITKSIPGLPPAERKAASIRAGMLSSTANQLLTGVSSEGPMAGWAHATDSRPILPSAPK
jgi:hypothetical protein